jgi:hypothetical protein
LLSITSATQKLLFCVSEYALHLHCIRSDVGSGRKGRDRVAKGGRKRGKLIVVLEVMAVGKWEMGFAFNAKDADL